MRGSLGICACTVATIATWTSVDSAGARVLDARGVRTIHLDVLGRPPLPAESAKLVGRPLAEVSAELVASPEFYPRWFEEQLYYFLLVNNFRPQSERIVAIPRDLAERRSST